MRLDHITLKRFVAVRWSGRVVTIPAFSFPNSLLTAAWRSRETELPGGHRASEPPDPIPNSEVKRRIADDSAGFPRAKVGHRQAPKSPPVTVSWPGVFLCSRQNGRDSPGTEPHHAPYAAHEAVSFFLPPDKKRACLAADPKGTGWTGPWSWSFRGQPAWEVGVGGCAPVQRVYRQSAMRPLPNSQNAPGSGTGAGTVATPGVGSAST